MRKVGVTGGIATGKSSVTRILRELGFDVVDADILAREAVAPGSQALVMISRAFGESMITESGELDRARLGSAVFGNREKLDLLNSILHPLIRNMVADKFCELEKSGADTVFFDCPLLIEAGFDDMVDEVWVVYSDPAAQLARVILRDGISEEGARKRIASQMPIDDKLAYADKIIKNTLSLEVLEQRVVELLREERISFGE